MSRAPLHVPSFAGGVVRDASADTKRTDELAECDGYDIVARGSLVPAEQLSDYSTVLDPDGLPLEAVFAIHVSTRYGAEEVIVVGRGEDGGADRYFVSRVDGAIENPFVTGGNRLTHADLAGAGVVVEGVTVTFASVDYVDAAGDQLRPLFINFARRTFATGPGLFVYTYTPSTLTYALQSIEELEASLGDGTSSKQLYFRGIIQYNTYIFGYGHDESATDKAGPSRVMFCNALQPFKWGNDDLGGGANRLFSDTDAVFVGSASEEILAALVWRGRLWFGSDGGLHWLEGFGRESFLTDGANSESNEYHVIGPHTMIEGPDGLMYGCGTEGLWRFDGRGFADLGKALRDRDGRALGWWDLLWRRHDGGPMGQVPGRSNMDLTWMIADIRRGQVWVVIPFCDASAGYGQGNDTVVIKYHVASGGFTRQVFNDVALTHGAVLRRGTADRQETFLTSPNGATIRQYGHRANAAAITPIADDATVTIGPYAPFGPNGVGVVRKVYVTISYDPGALPVQLELVPIADGAELASAHLTVTPTEPTLDDGALWLNSTTGILYQRRNGAWQFIPGGSAAQGRVNLPVAFAPTRLNRIAVRITPAAGTGRHAIEGFAIGSPALIRAGK